jgi:hypothetical protein
VSFLRRLLGGAKAAGDATEPATEPADAGTTSSDPEADERARELDLLRGEQSRLDELRQRQLRYADRAWTPPVQGGERRADDGIEGDGSDSAG